MQVLGCKERRVMWVDLCYEPALGSFLEWQPVANFFGQYIQQLLQVNAM